jgi:hypothetical protein
MTTSMKNNISSFLIALIAGLLLLSCDDEKVYFQNFVSGEGVKVKFIHAASDTAGVNLFLDGIKITANSPSAITVPGSPNLGKVNIGTVTFSNAFPVTNYATTANTSGAFSVVFPESYNATTAFATKTLSTVNASSLNASAYYTIAFVGVSPTYETIVYEDDLSQAPIDGRVYIRFANFLNNSINNLTLVATPPPTDEDPNPAQVILFQNISYKEMTDFMPLTRTGTYSNIRILNASNDTIIATLLSANRSLIFNKVYTIFAHGQVGGTGAAAPGISRMINR